MNELNEVFLAHDINEDLTRVITCAGQEGVLTPMEIFIAGMNLATSKDWEDSTELVQFIEGQLVDAYTLAVKGLADMAPTTREAVQGYWFAKREAAEDSACEVSE